MTPGDPLYNQKDLEKTQHTNDVAHAIFLIEQTKLYSKLTTGDILVQKMSDGKSLERSCGTGIPERYMVVCRDEHDLTYVRKICAGGRLGRLFCLNTDRRNFDLDPAVAESILLGKEFDPNKELEKMSKHIKQITKLNKELREPSMNTIVQTEKMIQEKLQPGTVFWLINAWDERIACKYQYEVISLKWESVSRNLFEDDVYRSLHRKHKLVVKVKAADENWAPTDNIFTSDDIMQRYLYLKQPYSYQVEI